MPKVVVELPYDILERIVKAYPGMLVEEAVRRFILDSVGGGVRAAQPAELQVDSSRIQRIIQDMVNPFTAKVDDMLRRLGSITELLDSLSDRVRGLEEEVKSIKEGSGVQVVKQPPKEVRKSAIDVLKDQKVMYEKDIASKIRNRDAFFDRLRRDGAVVIEAKGQRVAVEPNYFKEFKALLESLSTSNESEIKERLGRVGHNLLKTLWEGGVIYYDSINRKWRFAEGA